MPQSARSRTGILLLQLGTPDAPTTPALRRYLRQFLSDVRVVDTFRPLWWAILNGVVLVTRPARSARLYASVWSPEGSPLLVTSEAQARALEAQLADTMGDGAPCVAVAMRYGNPSTERAVADLRARGCNRFLAFPMYPQYASATTGSSLEDVMRVLMPERVVSPLRVVPPYPDDPAYIDALVDSARRAFVDWVPDHIVLSFHGIPKRYAELGDPYPEHCTATTRAFAAALDWPPDRLTMSYQSLFGREEWLRPYTDQTLKQLAGRGFERLAVFCPGFLADCLETLEEIGITGREQYRHAGGRDYRLIPCLNVNEAWVDGMTRIVTRELAGWD
ncbi:MAG: ferrochelatase [Acidobacteria bacterium SCN 69-37]|mgnify:CR=1 FL=1|nr:MAG: ferrochelatase [Acidobacteria bacterium SCN 69-37]